MKKYLPLINLVLLIILMVFCFYLFKSVNHFSTNLELGLSSKSDPVVDNIGMDFILGKIDSNFNIVLVIVGVLFILFNVLTYASVREGFKFQLSLLNRRVSKTERKWDEHKKEIKSLKGDLSFEVGKIISRLDLEPINSKPIQDLKDKDYVDIVELSLVICDYYSQSLLLKSDVYPKFEKSVKSDIKSILSDTSELIPTQTKFELNSMGYTRFLRLQKNIEQVCDLEDKQNLSLIFSKLNFPDLD